jgi:hypothetical protein
MSVESIACLLDAHLFTNRFFYDVSSLEGSAAESHHLQCPSSGDIKQALPHNEL